MRSRRRTLYFVVSAIFHYLGPAFAVLLFARVERARASRGCGSPRAALVFALWRRPWRVCGARPRRPAAARRLGRRARGDELLLLPRDRPAAARHRRGDRVPARDRARRARRAHAAQRRRARARRAAASTCSPTCALEGEPLGVALAFANARAVRALHRARPPRARRPGASAASTASAPSMLVAAVVVTPLGGLGGAARARRPRRAARRASASASRSSVIPYVADQLAMARLPRATYALMVSLLPATATVIGVVVLAQLPSARRGRRASRWSSPAWRCTASRVRSRRDRPARALARVRREARLRRAADVRRHALHAGPAELGGADVAIVGAPTDDLVSDRPGARFGAARDPRRELPARPAPRGRVDGFAELRVVDYGDAPVLPADPARTHEAIEAHGRRGARRRRDPDRPRRRPRIAEPDIRACAARHGPVGLVHFDTHTDTGTEVFGVEVSHGTPMYRLVEAGHVDPRRYVQIGLRGYWPGEAEFAWQARARASRASSCTTCASAGSRASSSEALAIVGDGPAFLSVDVDVLDPAFAPGTGTPEPGGMTTRRPALGRAATRRRRARAGRRRRRRGDPDRRRLGRHHRARRRADRARDPHRDRAAARAG